MVVNFVKYSFFNFLNVFNSLFGELKFKYFECFSMYINLCLNNLICFC